MPVFHPLGDKDTQVPSYCPQSQHMKNKAQRLGSSLSEICIYTRMRSGQLERILAAVAQYSVKPNIRVIVASKACC